MLDEVLVIPLLPIAAKITIRRPLTGDDAGPASTQLRIRTLELPRVGLVRAFHLLGAPLLPGLRADAVGVAEVYADVKTSRLPGSMRRLRNLYHSSS